MSKAEALWLMAKMLSVHEQMIILWLDTGTQMMFEASGLMLHLSSLRDIELGVLGR
jgi:hypothetical protein